MYQSLRTVLITLLFGFAVLMTLIGFIISYQQVKDQVITTSTKELFNELNLLQSEFEQLFIFEHSEGISHSISSRAAQSDILKLILTDNKGNTVASMHPEDIGNKWDQLGYQFSEAQYQSVLNNFTPKVAISNDNQWIDGMITVCHSDFTKGLRSKSCGITIYRKNLGYQIEYATKGLIKQFSYTAFGSIIAVILLFYITHYLITKRVTQIKNTLLDWDNGQRNVRINLSGHDELKDIADLFDLLVENFNQEELALQQSQQLNQAIIGSTNYSIISTTPDGMIKSFNNAAEILLGFKEQEVVNVKNFTMFNDIKQIEVKAKELSGALKQSITAGFEVFTIMPRKGEIYADEWTFINKSGERIPVHLSVSALYDKKYKVTGYLGVAYDISAQKEYERKLHLAEKVFNNTSEAIVVTDEDLKIININHAYEEMTGYSRAQIIGEKINYSRSGRHDKNYYRTIWNSINEKGMWHGEIWNRRRNGESYPSLLTINTVKRKNGKICNYVGILKDITNQKLAEGELERLAYHDQLTQLPNRVLFGERLGREIISSKRKKALFALFYIDLNRFKEVNDTYGHEIGDELLIQVADRLNQCVREIDTVARLGGDEFSIILTNNKNNLQQKHIANIAEKICQSIEQPFIIKNKTISVGVSIGIALFPDHTADRNQLIKFADTAMYKAKTTLNGGYIFHNN